MSELSDLRKLATKYNIDVAGLTAPEIRKLIIEKEKEPLKDTSGDETTNAIRDQVNKVFSDEAEGIDEMLEKTSSKDIDEILDVADEKVSEVTLEQPKAKPVANSTKTYNIASILLNGVKVREYSLEAHGVVFKNLAEEYVEGHPGAQIKFEDSSEYVICPNCKVRFRPKKQLTAQ